MPSPVVKEQGAVKMPRGRRPLLAAMIRDPFAVRAWTSRKFALVDPRQPSNGSTPRYHPPQPIDSPARLISACRSYVILHLPRPLSRHGSLFLPSVSSRERLPPRGITRRRTEPGIKKSRQQSRARSQRKVRDEGGPSNFSFSLPHLKERNS